MSILLDALKKSEEQRQLGKTPSIHSPGGEPPGGHSAGRQWIPLALVAVAAIALAWIGWQQYRLPPGGEADRQGAVVAGQPAEIGSRAAERPADAEAARHPGASRRTPVEVFEPEAKSPQGAAIVLPTDLQAEEPSQPQAKRSVSTVTTGSAASKPDETLAERPAQNPAQNPAQSADAPGLAPQGLASPEASEKQAQPHIPEPISYWELPQGVRDDLPDMRITVLVYAERPQDRFVLVSGQRLVEKDQLEGGVVLEEIRRDGAVFQYRTYRFLLKG